MMMYSKEKWSGGALVERVEIERLDLSTVEYRRLDGGLNIVEQRPVTAAELQRFSAWEASQRREQIRVRAQSAISRLQQIEQQVSSRTAIVGDANNIAQANAKFDAIDTQLQGAANALRDVARMVRYIIAHDVVPALLDDAAFDDLDG